MASVFRCCSYRGNRAGGCGPTYYTYTSNPFNELWLNIIRYIAHRRIYLWYVISIYQLRQKINRDQRNLFKKIYVKTLDKETLAMKLTVLGKYGPFAGSGGGTSSYLVQEGKTAIALDFGSGAMGRLQNKLKTDELSAIVLSHLHYDHISDLFTLGYYLQAAGKKLDLIMPTEKCLQYDIINGFGIFNIIPIEQGSAVADDISFEFKKMIHAVTSYAIKVRAGDRTLCYSGDTQYCDALVDFAANSDLLLLDCGRAENARSLNLSLSDAENIAEQLKIKTIATHINSTFEYKPKSNWVELAEELKTYKI